MYSKTLNLWICQLLVLLIAAIANPDCSRSFGCDQDWVDNIDKAREIAADKDRDLLLLFTGSDWCPPCQKLEEEILSKPEFLEEARNQYVLVKLDFPRETPLLPKIQEQNNRLATEFGVNGFPTIILADKELRPFAITGAPTEGVEAFLGYLGEQRQRRIRRDEWLAEAAKLEGADRADALDKALGEIDPDIARLYYEPLIAEIVELDADNQLGLREKWNGESDREMRKIILTDIMTIARLEKPEPALEFIDEVLQAIPFEPEQLLQIHQIRLNLLRSIGDNARLDAALDELIQMEALTEESRQRMMVKKIMLMAGTNRRDQAMKQLDDWLAKFGDSPYLWMARGELYEAAGDYDAAIKALDMGLKNAQQNPDLYFELLTSKADCLVAKDDALTAIQILDSFAEDTRRPSDLRGEALLHKALIMREQGRLRLARLAENRAIEIQENADSRAQMQKLVDRLRRKYDQ